MKLSEKEKKIDTLYETVQSILETINKKIHDWSLNIDDEYFSAVKGILVQIKTDLEHNNFNQCFKTCDSAKEAITKELEVINLFNETSVFIEKKIIGSRHDQAIEHQQNAKNLIKKGLLTDAREEINRARIAAEPAPEFLLQDLKNNHQHKIKEYTKGNYAEALVSFIEEKESLTKLHAILEERKEVSLLETITSSISEDDFYIKEIKNVLKVNEKTIENESMQDIPAIKTKK